MRGAATSRSASTKAAWATRGPATPCARHCRREPEPHRIWMSDFRQKYPHRGARIRVMIRDFESRYRAVSSRDGRFDGWFIVAVTSTGIYCRPSCPAVTPKRENVRFYPTAGAAQYAGFRACKRCLPDAVPGSPEWDVRADVAGRAMRLISDGVVDREGVSGLARRLGYTRRHLHRLLLAELGAGPLALARTRRAHTARLLLEASDLPVWEVAFASGFSSIRQFNETVRSVFAATPGELRRAGRRAGSSEGVGEGEIHLRLPYREPFDAGDVLGFLGARAVPGIEAYDGGVYRRTLRLPRGAGTVALSAGEGRVRCVLRLEDLRDLGAAVQRCRRLLDLDADPVAVAGALALDPTLAPLVARRRGPCSVSRSRLAGPGRSQASSWPPSARRCPRSSRWPTRRSRTCSRAPRPCPGWGPVRSASRRPGTGPLWAWRGRWSAGRSRWIPAPTARRRRDGSSR